LHISAQFLVPPDTTILENRFFFIARRKGGKVPAQKCPLEEASPFLWDDEYWQG
jgi:hypothetical protein